jgi:hypothetical protein
MPKSLSEVHSEPVFEIVQKLPPVFVDRKEIPTPVERDVVECRVENQVVSLTLIGIIEVEDTMSPMSSIEPEANLAPKNNFNMENLQQNMMAKVEQY